MAPGDRLDDELVEVGEHVAASLGVAAPPGLHRREQELLAQQVLGQSGQERQHARVLEHPAAEGVDDRHRAEARGLDQPGHAEHRVAAELQRVAEHGVGAAQDHVDGLQPAEGPQPHPAVAHGQVGGLHQRVAEVRGQVGVLEGGLAGRAGGEHHDPRVVGRRRGDDLQRRSQHAEERRQPVHLGVPVHAGEHPGHHDSVLERIPRTRGRLSLVGQDGEAARGIPHEVDGGGEQLLAAGEADAVALADEAGVGEHHLRRQQPPAQQVATAVQVGEDEVQELGPLHHRPLDGGPLLAAQQHRQRVEGPGRGSRGVVPVHVVRDPVVVEQAARLAVTEVQLVEAELVDDPAGVGPVLPHPPVGSQHLVVHPGLGPVRVEQVGHRGRSS